MADDNIEQVLIVYSVSATHPDDIAAVEKTVAQFRIERRIGAVRATARVFRIPDAAAPLAALGLELKETMDSCVGAIVFVDDLRPNVAYELGYFHGRGRPVLLLSRRDVDEVWRQISDLAGAALADLRRIDLGEAVSAYLTRVYQRDLALVTPVPLLSLPSETDNFLSPDCRGENLAWAEGPWGPALRVTSYEPPTELEVGRNLLPGARVRVLLRAPAGTGDFGVYARVRFQNHDRNRRRIWLGVSSLRRDMWITRLERLFPGRTPTRAWQMLTLELSDLLKRGLLLGAEGPDFIQSLRFRAGARDRAVIEPIEVGYVGLSGQDR